MVGAARVFCTHGNEVDPWNYVRYEDLSKAGRRVNAGRSLDASEWEPNAGTKLVKDVMNEVKRRYAWIDLLKPETQAALGVLLVLDPKQAEKIGRFPAIVGKLITGAREYDGRLSVDAIALPDPAVASAPSTIPVEKLLGPNVTQSMRSTGDDMLLTAEQNYQTPRGRAAQDQTLGTPQLIWDRLTGWLTRVGPDEALRRALLDWLKDDKTFALDTQDYTFKQVRSSIGSGIDFVVTGHSHLARAIDMSGGRYYFNCGTWIRLMQFTSAMLKDTASFQPVYAALTDGKMKTLDSATFGGEPFVLDRTTAVRIRAEGGKTSGALLRIDDSQGMMQTEQEFTRP
jgi:UDP-2,3-diacylglucosamine pyrophosphatase LpxH